jgi:glycosyltransferase involved in cell wall biosynthesis
MGDRPRLLYLSPVVPALGGNGLAMRAGMVLEALATRNRVWLVVCARYQSPVRALPDRLAALCEGVAILAPDDGPAQRPPTRRPFVDARFDIVHVFRLAMLPDTEPYLGGMPWRRPRRHLDLDDVESSSGERLAALYRAAGDLGRAHRTFLAAAQSRALEARALERFDRVYVCSCLDRERLQGHGRATICVLPNAVRLPDPPPPPPGEPPFVFLFAGTLGYYPNEDAAFYLCREILPRLRALAPAPFRIHIVGAGARRAVLRLAQEPEVEVLGAVQDIAPCYHRAGAVVVPLRAGGGTRIKVLEAFSYERPVVSTRIGVEGIEVRDGQEVLIADTPAAFAAACARLMRDPLLATALAACAHALLLRSYTTAALMRALEARAPE